MVSTNYVGGDDIEQLDCYIGIATSDSAEALTGMDFVLLHLQSKNQINMTVRSAVTQNPLQLLRTARLPGLHQIDITQIIALTDFDSRLQFVTTSLDCTVKVIEIEDNEEEAATISYEILADGEIINALALHGPTSLFCVSTYDAEREQSHVQVWRRRTKQAEFGPFDVMTLDFKLVEKNFICLADPNDNGSKLVIYKV